MLTFSSVGNKTDSERRRTYQYQLASLYDNNRQLPASRIGARSPAFPYLELKGPIVCSTSARKTSLVRSNSCFVYHRTPRGSTHHRRTFRRNGARREETAKMQKRVGATRCWLLSVKTGGVRVYEAVPPGHQISAVTVQGKPMFLKVTR